MAPDNRYSSSKLVPAIMVAKTYEEALQRARELARESGAFLLALEPLRGLSDPVVAVSAHLGSVIYRGNAPEVRESLAQQGIQVILEGSGPEQDVNSDLDNHYPGEINVNHTVSYEDRRIARDRGVYLLTLSWQVPRGHAPRAVAISYRTGAIIAKDNLLWVQSQIEKLGAPIVAEYAIGAGPSAMRGAPELQ